MKKIFFCMYTLFFVTPYSLYAMNKPLSNIEQRLVVRAISQRGLAAVTSANDRGCLRISDSFFKSDTSENDPLATIIFNAIETIESKYGYNPAEKNDGRYTIPATNNLGNYTQYYWQQDNEFITVTSKIINKTAVMDIINHEKNAIDNNKK